MSASNDGWVKDDTLISDWITASDSSDIAKNYNGYYAYKLDLFTPQNTNLYGVLEASYSADDYLAAVFLNGQLIKGFSWNWNGSTSETDLAKEWTDASPLELSNIALNEGLNELVFLVHNTYSSKQDGLNATGFSLSGTLYSDAELFSEEKRMRSVMASRRSTTPEPATMLIFGCGMVGAGIAAARRRKK